MTTRRPRTHRGVTILENMLAMAVLLIGATGVAGVQRQSTLFLGDARKITRAAAFAGDLASQIQLWEFDDPRLANADAANDADLGDSTFQFLVLDTPPADHGEADLTLAGRVWTGLPGELLVANGMERYWNVSYDNVDSNGNAIPDAVRVAVIVRWRAAGAWRRIVVPVVKVNPAERM
jgi:Tfp pilus assembly protein PilV